MLSNENFSLICIQGILFVLIKFILISKNKKSYFMHLKTFFFSFCEVSEVFLYEEKKEMIYSVKVILQRRKKSLLIY